MSRAKELTDAHWDNYVGPLLSTAGVDDKTLALCAFVYKSSGIHFYKHAEEDARDRARSAFEQRQIQESMTGGSVDVSPVSVCADCTDHCDQFSPYRTVCAGNARETARAAFTPVQDPCAKCATGECTEHKEIAAKLAGTCEDRAVDEWVTKSLCKQCNNPDVVCYQGQPKVNGTCKDFQP